MWPCWWRRWAHRWPRRIHEHNFCDFWRLGEPLAQDVLRCEMASWLGPRGAVDSPRRESPTLLPPSSSVPQLQRNWTLSSFVYLPAVTTHTPAAECCHTQNHGGGYQYRLCPSHTNLTEECFRQTPVPFAGDSSLMLSNGTKIQLKSNFVSNGTLPVGSTWQTVPIPTVYNFFQGTKDKRIDYNEFQFEPPCCEYFPRLPFSSSLILARRRASPARYLPEGHHGNTARTKIMTFVLNLPQTNRPSRPTWRQAAAPASGHRTSRSMTSSVCLRIWRQASTSSDCATIAKPRHRCGPAAQILSSRLLLAPLCRRLMLGNTSNVVRLAWFARPPAATPRAGRWPHVVRPGWRYRCY